MTKIRKKVKKSQRIKREIAGKLLGYSALAGAALAMGATSAEAMSIHLSQGDNHLFDFDGDGTDDLVLSIFGGASSSGGTQFGVAFAYGQNGGQVANQLKYSASSSLSIKAKRFVSSQNVGTENFGSVESKYGFGALALFSSQVAEQLLTRRVTFLEKEVFSGFVLNTTLVTFIMRGSILKSTMT